MALLRVTSLGPSCGGKATFFFILQYYTCMKASVQNDSPIPLLQREVIPIPTLSVADCVIHRAAVVTFSPARSRTLFFVPVVTCVTQLQRVLISAAKAISRLSV
jgi:hypothetical protein